MAWSDSRRALVRAAVVLVIVALLLSDVSRITLVAAGSPPDAPVIASPIATNVGADDVHMEIGVPFSDPDGDRHVATDWEIRTGDGVTVVWAAYDSPELVHAHFSDGAFMNLPAGQRRLNYGTPYLFRVRFKDSSGDYSAWTERRFVTSRQVQTAAQQAIGVLAQPPPTWRTDGDAPLALPAGARLAIESGTGQPLLTLTGSDSSLLATTGVTLGQEDVVRLRIVAPTGADMLLPTSRLSVVIQEPNRIHRQTVFIPSVAVQAGHEVVLWPTETGATFYGTADEAHSSRQHLARDNPIPWVLEAGLRLEAVQAALQNPVSLAFVLNPGTDPSAPRLYVSELYGRIKVMTNDGRVFNFAEGLLNVNPTGIFPGSGELGVIGVCVVPGSHDVYATMVYRDSAGSLRNKLVRIVSDDGLHADRVDDLLVANAGQGLARASHQIQQCSYGPDGKLYTFVADGPDPAVAQDNRTFNGKVLRLNLDGSAPSDNPLYDPANPTAPVSYQYTKGQRNAFGMAWRQSDASMYMTENGPNVDRLVKIVAGKNYGWVGTDESMMLNALYNWPEPHWSPVGLTFVDGEAAASMPVTKQGHLLVATAGLVYATGPQRWGKAIEEFVLADDGSVVGKPRIIARYVGENKGSIADLKLRPDGLYFTDLYLEDGDGGPSAPGGKIWRIQHVGSVNFTASRTSGPAPLSVDFLDTSDVPGTERAWDFGDGTTASASSPQHTFTQPGRYVVALTRPGRDGQPVEHLELITVTGQDGNSIAAATDARLLEARSAASNVYFPETGIVLGGGFKQFWEANGSVLTFGYPITQEFREVNPVDGQEYVVQYFERARFEYHPEHKGTRHETQLGLLGLLSTARRANEPEFQRLTGGAAEATADRLVFAETGHSLSEPFRGRWEQTGGADIYGLPISEPLMETSEADGEQYLVQYFERARMEHHPEAAGTFDEISLMRLGTNLFVRRPGPRV